MEQEKVLENTANMPAEISAMAQIIIFGVISIASFFVPFSFGHPQWLVGTIVNTCLFLGAIFLPKKYYFPLAVFPSLGVLARGIVFGHFTWFLVYFLPFIWIGNLFLILIFKYVKNNFLLAAGLSATGKFILLFLAANIYFKFQFVPAVFLQVMGLNQFATALAGGLFSFLIWKIYLQRRKNY